MLGRVCTVIAIGAISSTTAAAETILVIDATSDPGIQLAATFVPNKPVPDGTRRVVTTETVTTSTVILMDQVLPVKWFVSVLKKGDLSPNQLTRPYNPKSEGDLSFHVFDDVTIGYRAGQWVIPSYDLSRYDVDVGIGLGSDIVMPAYTVRCRPNQTIAMTPGSYQWVQNDGQRVGEDIRADKEGWSVPMGGRTSLTLDETGQATPRPIP